MSQQFATIYDNFCPSPSSRPLLDFAGCYSTCIGKSVRGTDGIFPWEKRDTSTGWLPSRSGSGGVPTNVFLCLYRFLLLPWRPGHLRPVILRPVGRIFEIDSRPICGKCGRSLSPQKNNPDLPILAFFVFLAFFVLRFSLLFGAFLLSFPRISRGSAERKILAFFEGSSHSFGLKKARIGGSGKGLRRCHGERKRGKLKEELKGNN